jgi:hypothetical protein
MNNTKQLTVFFPGEQKLQLANEKSICVIRTNPKITTDQCTADFTNLRRHTGECRHGGIEFETRHSPLESDSGHGDVSFQVFISLILNSSKNRYFRNRCLM